MDRIDLHDKKEERLHSSGARIHCKNRPDGQERRSIQILYYTQINHEWPREKVILFTYFLCLR